jgi:hypothetical protein
MRRLPSVPPTQQPQQPQHPEMAALGDGESEVGLHPYAMSVATGSGEDTGVETGRSGSLATWHEEPAPPYRENQD